MKKTYQNPATTIVTIQTAQMLAGSLGFSSEGKGADLSDARRHRGVWDDDDDE